MLTSGRLATPAARPPFSIRLAETEAGYVTRTGPRGLPTSPRHAEAARSSCSCPTLPAPAATEMSVAAATKAASRPSCGASRRRRRIRIQCKITSERDYLDVPPRGGDHRRVVGAELERRERGAGKRGAQLGVRRHASDDGDPAGPDLLRCDFRPLDEGADDRPLIRGGEVRAAPLQLVGPKLAHLVQERGLEPREGEVEARNAGDRECDRLGVALSCPPIDRRAARIAEAEQPRTLVERLAGGVVERRPEDGEASVLLHVEEQRAAAAREEAQERR